MRSSRLHRAIVLQNRMAGGGFYRMVLRVPGLAAAAVPGQFIMLRVSENLDPLLARPFGISSVIAKRSIELYYRIVGRGTSLLSAVPQGDVLDVTGPLGHGFPMPPKDASPLLIAGGSGFPPLLYFARLYGKNAHLFVGSRDKECLPPSGAMKEFRRSVKAVHYATEDGSKGVCGFVTDALASYLNTPGDRKRIIYACGPHPMLAEVSRLAADRGVACYVSMEERMACGLGVCMGCSTAIAAGGYKRVCKEGPVFLSTDIDWAGNKC